MKGAKFIEEGAFNTGVEFDPGAEIYESPDASLIWAVGVMITSIVCLVIGG